MAAPITPASVDRAAGQILTIPRDAGKVFESTRASTSFRLGKDDTDDDDDDDDDAKLEKHLQSESIDIAAAVKVEFIDSDIPRRT